MFANHSPVLCVFLNLHLAPGDRRRRISWWEENPLFALSLRARKLIQAAAGWDPESTLE